MMAEARRCSFLLRLAPIAAAETETRRRRHQRTHRNAPPLVDHVSNAGDHRRAVGVHARATEPRRR
jgi:hypothetical protein